jgi:deazaflavin-dependent oxidoreductase (nitroreductase family)
MPNQRYSLGQRLFQKFAASRPGSWLFARTARRADLLTLKQTDGRATITTVGTGLPVLILTTVGAKSGLARTNPLVYIRVAGSPGAVAVVASNFGQKHNPAWYYNLKTNPRATITIGDQSSEYIARETNGEEYERLWQCALDMYIGFPLYKTRAGGRHIPIMVLEPVD